MSFRKNTHQELNSQVKDLKAQFQDQIKCFEHRTDTQITIYHEINEFCKRRADIELEYAKALEKLVKTSMVRCKNEKNKRANWNMYSACILYMQLVDDTKEEAKHKTTVSEVLGNISTASFNAKFSSMQKVSKKCREIGNLVQGEVLRVIDEMNTSMKTYQANFEKTHSVKEEIERIQHKINADVKNRHRRSREKSLEKLTLKHEKAKKLCDRARNEYILCIDAANASLHKFFADDLTDIMACMDVGTDYWLSLLLDNIIAARKLACQSEMNALAQLNEFRENMLPQCDKQRFFESNNTTFMLPKRFEFRADPHESTSTIQVDGAENDLQQRRYQMGVRLNGLRSETEKTRNDLMETETRIHALLAAQHAIQLSPIDGVIDSRPPLDQIESELDTALQTYTDGFNYFVLNANLMARLEARTDGISAALGLHDHKAIHPIAIDANNSNMMGAWSTEGSPRIMSSKFMNASTSSPIPVHNQGSLNASTDPGLNISQYSELNTSPAIIPSPSNSTVVTTAALRLMNSETNRPRGPTKSNETNVLSATTAGNSATTSGSPSSSTRSLATNSNNGVSSQIQHHFSQPHKRPRLFGGSLEEYCQATGEKIPLVVTSCINALAKCAIHQQGVFRISGSQVEINRLKEAFEEGTIEIYNEFDFCFEGEDPLRLRTVLNANDANSIAGVLKLYLRELRDPLFPFFMFERVIDCAKSTNTDEFTSKIVELIRKLPPSSYLLLRYLFAFLNFVSNYSEQNCMDTYNLAVCFGPTLLRVPDSNDQVYHQNYVNEAIKNLIIHHARIFSNMVPGPLFKRPALSASVPTTPALISAANEHRDLQFVDEGCANSTNGDSATPSTSGTVSTLNDTYMRPCILGDENPFKPSENSTAAPLTGLMNNSLSNSTVTSRPGALTSTPRSPTGSTGKDVTSTSNYCYSSSENNSTNNLNGKLQRSIKNDEVKNEVNDNAKLNDENALLSSAFHRRQFSEGNAGENALRQLPVSENSTAFHPISNGTKPTLNGTGATTRPEVHSKSGFLRHEYRQQQHAASVDLPSYQQLNASTTQSAFSLNKSLDLNNSGSSGGRTLERIRIPIAPKPKTTITSTAPHSPPQSNSAYLYSTVNKPKAAPFSMTTAASSVVQTVNKLDELMAEDKLNNRVVSGTKN
ncbi:hypothetical protein M3Y94_00413500 [Aphelenchoides besseyi]|nr:hypothetical protein M3Y94_00413500 [Aphelenchoides besseyi]